MMPLFIQATVTIHLLCIAVNINILQRAAGMGSGSLIRECFNRRELPGYVQ